MVKFIDYQSGTQTLMDLEIGEKVSDYTWQWEYRAAANYKKKRNDIMKHVVWIIVAKNHYEGIGPHVTLLSEESIGCFAFDDGTWSREDNRFSFINNWGLSGANKAEKGLRPWLNSNGIHSGEGFADVFSDNFRDVIFTTPVPNRDGAGQKYVTNDQVFIPSTTELGDTEHKYTYEIGHPFPYFLGASDITRQAELPGKKLNEYWTRSPDSRSRIPHSTANSFVGRFIQEVIDYDTLAIGGQLKCVSRGRFSYTDADNEYLSARPIVNMHANVRVSAALEKIYF